MSHEAYMTRALELASKGLGTVSPNPMVGCVIVHQGQIIGEGWHKKYGGPHAEVEAINSVIDKELLKDSICYVTLEPCSHHGKTPPCADLLVKHRIPKVIIANTDPNPLVNGKGIEKLKAAGAVVLTGVLEREARKLNKRFFASIEKKRPYILLKWAETADGFVAEKTGKPVSISGTIAQMYSHKWRTEEDAILVGAETVIQDNPSLTARHWEGRNPLRVIWDPNDRIPEDAKVLNDGNETLVFGGQREAKSGYDVINLIPKERNVSGLIKKLQERKVGSVLVEGGPRLHELFIKEGLFDEIRIFKSKAKTLKQGIPAAHIPAGITELSNQDLTTDILRFFSK